MSKIVLVPNQVLFSPAKEVKKIDKEINQIISEMKKALIATRNPKGVGLAATQIGLSLRIFITRPKETDPIRVFLNPEIIEKNESKLDKKSEKLEGCLSVPKIWGEVKRSTSLTLRYMDENNEVKEEKFSGFMAIIVQHETDHINGILFTQRVLEQKGKLFQTVKDNDGKEVLEEISLR